ncbi:DndE family protein [Burkholderia territorii]|uniref:DndE family protein n=1 Tax=Burkholderia territorii TaxID=1503055 RepID=UPI0009C02FC3|nr:DndE family protein [Burkholderia territorii]
MALSLVEIAAIGFKTSQAADELNNEIIRHLGFTKRYAAARLAIARSLALPGLPPSELAGPDDDAGKIIKGDTLFGTGRDLATWVALISEHAEITDISRKEFQALVWGHWQRGIQILHREWNEVGGDLQRFVVRLADNAGLAPTAVGMRAKLRKMKPQPFKPVAKGVSIRLGEKGTDVFTGEEIVWTVNGPGGSPHMALMGSVGTGKTRTAKAILSQLRSENAVPIIAFDLKGDLRDDTEFVEALGANIIEVPRQGVPLDVLSVDRNDETGLKVAASRFQESFQRIKVGGFGANQMDALRDATIQSMRAHSPVTLMNVRDRLKQVYAAREMKPDGATATFNQICDFNLFEPLLSAEEFFSQSWIITFPGVTEEIRKLVSYLLLDSLDRFLNGAADTATDSNGNRAIKCIIVVDEAHRLLGMKQPALSNLVRMSRSKGGVVMLISQKPDDFEAEEDDFIADMGLLASFRTNAKSGAAQRVLMEKSLSDLQDGVCVARIGGKAPVRVQAWEK